LDPQALPFILLQGFFFGTTLVASRFSVGQFAPILYVGLRLGMASLLHLAIYLFSSRSFPRDRDLLQRAMVYGVIGTAIPLVGIVTAMQYLSSGMASLLIALSPAFTVLLAHFFLSDESLSRMKILGVGLALFGAVFLALRGETGLAEVGQANPAGYLLILGANLFIGFTTIYARRRLRGMDDFDVSSVRMLTAAIVILPLALLLHGLDFSSVDGNGTFALGYATLTGTFGGSFLSFYVVKRFGATASAMPTYVIPIVASITGVALLGEQITWGMSLGMLLILAGLVLINREPVALSA